MKNKIISLLIFFLCFNAFAKRAGFEDFSTAVCVDLPEEFYITQTNGKTSFQFECSIVPVNAIIQIYPKEKYSDSKTALIDVAAKLSLDYDCDEFIWRNQKTAISKINGTLMNKKIQGYAAATVISENGSKIIMMAWSDEKNFDQCFPMIASFLDGLCIDSESWFESGILTSYAYPETGKNIDIEIEIGGKKIKTQMDKDAKEASEFLIEREYNILKLYAKSSKWKEAWQRYYRMIFRDSSKRLARASFDITNALAEDSIDETDLAQKLLTWMQNCEYKRDHSSTDFSSLPSMLLGNGSDCDSRSMMIAVILQSINVDSIIFVSSEYSHAICGLVSPHQGFGFDVDGKKYLTGETTAKGLTWGKINSEQTDFSMWIPVLLP